MLFLVLHGLKISRQFWVGWRANVLSRTVLMFREKGIQCFLIL